MIYQIKELLLDDGDSPFAEWFGSLDAAAAAKFRVALSTMEQGNLSNAEWFRERVLGAVAQAPSPPRWVVVAAEPVTSVDVTAGDMLAELDEALGARGIELCFAEMKGPVKDKLKRFGLFARFGEAFFFPTVGAAVSTYLESHRVEWQDWEDALR